MNSLTRNIRAASLAKTADCERLMAAIDDDSRQFESDDLSDMYLDGLEYWRSKMGADAAAH